MFSRSARGRTWLSAAIVCALASACGARTAAAAASTVPTGFADQSMAGSLSEPVGIAEVPGPPTMGTIRVIFIEQRTARVRLVVGGTLYTMGTVPNVTSAESERGLLGVAVDPAWPAHPYIYVHYTDNRSGSRIAISRFTVTGDLGFTGTGSLAFDPATRYDLLNNLPDNSGNHNGGTLRFGPNRTLFVSLGDDATGCMAQDIRFIGGKILRLDVTRLPATGAGPPPRALLIPPGNPFTAQPDSMAMLVWAYGLRNPFRFSIDVATGDLYVADVGEGSWEELHRVASGGMNLGWPLYEGPAGFTSCSQTPPSAPVGPIHSYDHGQGAVIISGGLYRRPAGGTVRFPSAYEGDCFFLDYVTGFMRRLKGSGTSWSIAPAVPGQPSSTDWGSGFQYVSDVLGMSDGSLWYVRRRTSAGTSMTGELRRIAYPVTLSVPDAGGDGVTFYRPQPTPSVRNATLRWSQARPDPVRLAIYDLSGRSVRTLQDGVDHAAGTHELFWNGLEDSGEPVGPGIYFARLQVGTARRQVRITLVH